MLRLRMPPEAFFSHATAAVLHGIPLPFRYESGVDLHVSFRRPARAPHASGIRGHRSSASEAEVQLVRGIRTTTPARTWIDLADHLSTFDLVAAGDFLIHHRMPLTDLAALAHAVDTRTNPRHLKRLHEAYPLLSDRAESPPESILRAILLSAGFPNPEVNHSLTGRFGEFVARTDLSFASLKLVLEYQGDYHRTTKGQWRADMSRRSRLEALGWVVIELNADDLRDPGELVARIRSRLAHRT